MKTTWWIDSAWLISVLGEAVLAAAILLQGKLKRWPGLWLFCVASAIAESSLWAVHAHYEYYFYGYYCWMALQAVLRLFILADVLRSIPAASIVGVRFPFACGLAGALMAAMCWELSYKAGAPFPDQAVHTAVLLDRCVTFSWAAFLAVILAGIAISGLGWMRDGATVVSGLVLRVVGEMLGTYLYSVSIPFSHLIGTIFDSSFCLIALWAWYIAIRTREVLPEPHELMDALFTAT